MARSLLSVVPWPAEFRFSRQATRATPAGTETLTWDHNDPLVSLATSGGATYSYGYDYRTRRVIRDESAAGGVKSVLSFSGGTNVQEANASGVVQAEFIRGSDWGGGVGGVLYSVRGGTYSFNAYNSRGDVVSTTDAAGAATWQAAYEAFGTRTAEQGANDERQRANTKDEDPTGLLNEGMRYRDLEAGVFISRDPAGFVDGPNVYTYVGQNPWTMFDPDGLFMQYFGDWAAEKFGAPPAPVAFMAKHSGKVTGTVHAINGVVSFVPALGKVADGLDASISAAEGNYGEAALTAGGGKAAQLGKAVKVTTATVLAAKVISHLDEVTKVASHLDEAVDVVRIAENSADDVVDVVKTARTASKETADKLLKNARQRGVDRAKAAERDLVKSGHPGTADEGWTWAERKQIAEKGQFPSDTRMHHINDVKSNPDLADIADNVIPSRGRAAGHVKKYHPEGTQSGSSGDLIDRQKLKEKHLNGE